VVAAQHRLDGQLAEAKSLLSVEGNLCTATSTPTPPPGGTPTGPPTPPPGGTPTGSPTGTASPLPTPTPSVTPSSPSPTPTPTVTPTQSATQSSSGSASDSATQGSSVAPTTTATAMAYISTPPTSSPAPTTCQAAIDDVMTVQTSIASTEQSLANSEADLDKLLGEVYSQLEKSAGSGGTGGGAGSGSGGGRSGTGGSGGGTGTGGTGTGGTGAGGTGSGRTGSGGSGFEGGAGGGSGGSASSGPATAAQLASDQANLDSANAELSEARQDLAAATLDAPISGTIALVNVTPGQQVTGSQSSSSTSADFVIEGAGGEEATTTVSVSDIGEIKVGQPATITLDGSATPINGEVTSIGMLSSSSTTGSASYPVTIGLASGAPTLFAGSDAQVAITLAKVGDAVTVPTSAVEGSGAATFVTVLRGGRLVRVRIVVGATGPVLTQVTSGLTVGEQVVLADLSTPLPTNTNPFAARSLTTGGGGFGGGRGGGGATGGGARG
jgi:trimeric autotransporter adhesin